jgi:hypothetical protein
LEAADRVRGAGVGVGFGVRPFGGDGCRDGMMGGATEQSIYFAVGLCGVLVATRGICVASPRLC